MVSDLKSDLVMTTSQQRPNVHLMANPAVQSDAEGGGEGVFRFFALGRSSLQHAVDVSIYSNCTTDISFFYWTCLLNVLYFLLNSQPFHGEEKVPSPSLFVFVLKRRHFCNVLTLKLQKLKFHVYGVSTGKEHKIKSHLLVGEDHASFSKWNVCYSVALLLW